MTRSILAFAITGAVWTAPFAGRQAQQPTPVFRSTVDLVHFDVSVLDRDRRPVRGLSQADFTILEDGKPQPVAAFAAVDVPPPTPLPAAKWLREVSPDVRTNEPEQNPEGRLFVLLLDDALLPADPAAVQAAKKIGRGVVDRIGPLDQVAVVFSYAGRNAQNFTTDRAKLLAAIDSLQAGPASHRLGWDNVMPKGPPSRGASLTLAPVVDSDAGLRLGSLRTLQQVSETLIAAPKRRKALIFVSPGVTIDLESDARPVKQDIYDPGGPIREANHRLAREMPEVFRRLARANVTVYSLDPCGLGGLESYILTAVSGLPSLKGAINPTPPFYHWLAPSAPPRPSDLAHHASTIAMDFLIAAAANTGGRAIVNTNDFDPGLDGLFEENASYYLLAYANPAKNAIGTLHRVTVRVNRPGVTVRTRSGYETEAAAPSANKAPGSQPTADVATTSALAAAAAGPVAAGELPLEIALAPVRAGPGNVGSPARPSGNQSPASSDTVVTIVLGFRQTSVAARTSQTIDLQTSIFTPDGRGVGAPRRQTVTFTIVPRGGDAVRYEVLTQVALAPGRYELRVAAHRATDDLSGSVYADVEVPDFTKAPLSLSGVWIEANPGSSALPRDAFAALLPVVPTASRAFGTADEVTVFFRVYQGGDAPLGPVHLTARLVNDRDVTVAETTTAIGVERFDAGARAADHRFALPLRGMPLGRYLLRIDATLGQTTARRDVVFAVR